mgnify:CR=1 FL=1
MDFESKITPDRVENDIIILKMIRGELSLTASFWVFSLLSNFIFIKVLIHQTTQLILIKFLKNIVLNFNKSSLLNNLLLYKSLIE